MDIINPGIIVIGKQYYRNNIISQKFCSNIKENYNQEYFDEEPCDYDELKSNFDIFEEGTDFVCNLNVSQMFYGFIIGKRGETKKLIELDTKTDIIIPKQGTTGKLIVKGKTYASVDRALTRITNVVEYGRQNLPFTHFFSIPTNNISIMNNFELFKNEVLRTCIGDRGVNEKLFQKSFKLHLTLSTLVIGDHDELNNVVALFNEFKNNNEPLFMQPLKVHIKGLEYMNDDPCEVRVLYGKVDNGLDSNKLQQLADNLTDFLVEKHVIMVKENNSVKLHMTVLNASFIHEHNFSLDTADDVKNPGNFDCSNILKKFADWDFGVVDINEICLSKRHGAISNTYYTNAASFAFGF